MRTLFDEPEPEKTGPKLMDLQQRLLTEGRKAYRGGVRRVLWQAPCGAGKTWVAAEQSKSAVEMGRRVLHIVHRRRLVDQMIDTLRRFDIYASPIMEGRVRWESPVMCASRDTLLSILEETGTLPTADLLIWDEAHVAARRVQNWYLKNCPDAYWTGYTATPVKPDGSSLSPPYQALVSMGKTSELITLGRLCPVKVFNPDEVGKRRRKGDKVKPVGDPISHWKRYAEGMPTVVFADTVAASQEVARRYIAAGVSAEHIDASTPDEVRDAVFKRSETGETRVICNCGVLIEGVDLPWLTCCQILRGCNSLVLWFQACGRVMRTFGQKLFAIVLDHSGAAHEFGLPDADFNWSLGNAALNAKLNKQPKEKRPVTCPKCSATFSPKPICPECGHKMPRQKRKNTLLGQMSQEDGVLTEFVNEQQQAIGSDRLLRLWKKLLYMARAKGRPMRWCSAVFAKEAKIPPWQANLGVRLPYGRGGWDMPAADWLRDFPVK